MSEARAAHCIVIWELPSCKDACDCALEVGYLSKGMGKFRVRRPKGSEGCSEVTAGESPDELTLRAEAVGTWATYINVDHIEKERWGPPLFDCDCYAFCQELYKGIEGEDWREFLEMSRAVV